MQTNQTCDCACHQPSDPLSGLPLAMGYVPWQTFNNTMDLCKALQLGTIFPELNKPFCGYGKGKRGGCR